MMNVKEFIKIIQKNPKMFVDEVRVDYLENIINGFLICNLMNERSDNIDLQFKFYFSDWLVMWIKKNVHKKYEKRHFAWCQTLNDVTKDDVEAVELFFHLCDEFFKEYENKEFHRS